MTALHLVKTTRGAVWALRQVEVLCALGVDVTVALPSARTGLAPEYAKAGARVVEANLDFTCAPDLMARLRRCRALVDRLQPDVIHSHFVGTTVVARLALGRAHPVPRIFQVPGPLHLEHTATRALEIATSGPLDYWIGSCRWTCEAYVKHGVPRERVFFSHYGTDLGRLAPTGERRQLRAELGIIDAAPLIGMVAHVYRPRRLLGQWRGIKGHEDFIDAVAILRRRMPALRAVVVGGAWTGADGYEKRLRSYARRRCGGAIHFLGHRTDVADIYADLDVAVHPSLSENCGAAVESLAAACPTVATAVGGLPDVVIDGETGWLEPPCQPQRLAGAIRCALGDRDEARRRARAGQTLVRRLFGVERTAGEVLAVYRNIVRRTDPAERIAV